MQDWQLSSVALTKTTTRLVVIVSFWPREPGGEDRFNEHIRELGREIVKKITQQSIRLAQRQRRTSRLSVTSIRARADVDTQANAYHK